MWLIVHYGRILQGGIFGPEYFYALLQCRIIHRITSEVRIANGLGQENHSSMPHVIWINYYTKSADFIDNNFHLQDKILGVYM